MKIKPHKRSTVEERKATNASNDALWNRYFATPPGLKAIAILQQIKLGVLEDVPDDVRATSDLDDLD